MYRQKVGISYCGDKTGFPRPGHIPYSGFFLRIKIFTNWPFPDFRGENLSQIIRKCLLKSKHFEGKIFTNHFDS